MDSAIILTRFVQIAAGMALCGTPLFFLYGHAPVSAWPRRLLSAAAVLGLLGVIGWLMAQAASFGDGPKDAFDPAKVWDVASGTSVGQAGLARAALFALAALAPWTPGAGRKRWIASAAVGALAAASLARLGHGAVGDGIGGAIHLAADIAHLLAAGVWIGALVPLLVLVLRSGRSALAAERRAAHVGLEGFSGVGLAVVAVLIASGLVNGWFLVGPSRIAALPSSPWGLAMIAKLVLFCLMLGLAAANRFVFTPALARSLEHDGTHDLGALRASVLAETVLAVLVLALVAWLGVMPPPEAG